MPCCLVTLGAGVLGGIFVNLLLLSAFAAILKLAMLVMLVVLLVNLFRANGR